MATAKAGFEKGKVYAVKGHGNCEFMHSNAGWHVFKESDGSYDPATGKGTFSARSKDVKPAGKGKAADNGAPSTDGKRVFRTFDPDTGDVKRLATFKIENYVKHDDESTEGGFIPLDIDDEAAGSLRGLGLEEQFEEAAKIVRGYRDDKWPGTKTVIEQEMRDRYSKLNPGQIRMNLGNVIRGCANRAERAEEEA